MFWIHPLCPCFFWFAFNLHFAQHFSRTPRHDAKKKAVIAKFKEEVSEARTALSGSCAASELLEERPRLADWRLESLDKWQSPAGRLEGLVACRGGGVNHQIHDGSGCGRYRRHQRLRKSAQECQRGRATGFCCRAQ